MFGSGMDSLWFGLEWQMNTDLLIFGYWMRKLRSELVHLELCSKMKLLLSTADPRRVFPVLVFPGVRHAGTSRIGILYDDIRYLKNC